MIVQCPLCNSAEYSVIYDRMSAYPVASIVQCAKCSHLYALLKHSLDQKDLYSDETYRLIETRDSIFDKILNWEYRRVLREISRITGFKGLKGSLLDFGSGKGKFASLAKNQGWEVKCVETATERAGYARRIYQLEVSNEYYSSGKIFNQEFDVLTMFHVLEHLPHPQVLLSELLSYNLKKDGLLVIEVPNFNSWQSRIAKSKWMHLDAYRHINHFTPERLDQLVIELHLKPVKTTFFSFHLGVLGMTDSLLKIFGYRKNIIYELKTRKNIFLILSILFVLPFAFLTELIAAACKRGGIIRRYVVVQGL